MSMGRRLKGSGRSLRLLASVWLLAAGMNVSIVSPALAESPGPVVQTAAGKVQGVLQGRAPGMPGAQDVLAFRGIPFGDSVAGERRWTLAQPAPPWRGVLDAAHFKPACAQLARYNLTEASEAEDCLTLNISRPFQPDVPLREQTLPVLVWIHGGAFVGGSGSLYRLDRLARDANAVVVSFNYRLGVFGFMPHPAFDAEHNGGYALEDQLLAMKWVQDNISEFGGDPDNITLAGESAGGASVCMHLMTPERTQGLFHKAIITSAACSFGLRSAEQWGSFGEQVAREAGCAKGTDVLECLRGKDANALMQAGDRIAGSDLAAFAPVYGTRTLPRQGLESLESGKVLPIPLLYSGTRDELRLYVGYAVQAGDVITHENYLDHLRAVYGDHAQAVLERYPADRESSAAAALGSVNTDFHPGVGLNHCQYVDTARLLSRHLPIFKMEFADRTVPVLGVSIPAKPDPGFELGAVHSSDLNYFFPNFSNTSRMNAPDLSLASQQVADDVVKSWASFMRTGIPVSDGLPQWLPFNVSQQSMRVGPGQIAMFDPESEYQCGFWKKLYPASFSGPR
ncbi:carboxylesterase/lipase family protein [Orrella marina]|nr:carboxylesterase family protein [Orrella marina]